MPTRSACRAHTTTPKAVTCCAFGSRCAGGSATSTPAGSSRSRASTGAPSCTGRPTATTLPDEAADWLRPFLRGAAVAPIVRLDVTRTRHRLVTSEDELIAEVAHDDVRASGLGAEVRAPRWHEVEVELGTRVTRCAGEHRQDADVRGRLPVDEPVQAVPRPARHRERRRRHTAHVRRGGPHRLHLASMRRDGQRPLRHRPGCAGLDTPDSSGQPSAAQHAALVHELLRRRAGRRVGGRAEVVRHPAG